jgi:hypothetical protein
MSTENCKSKDILSEIQISSLDPVKKHITFKDIQDMMNETERYFELQNKRFIVMACCKTNGIVDIASISFMPCFDSDCDACKPCRIKL